MVSKFLKPHEIRWPCGSCGSTMLRRWADKTTGRERVYCFCCGAGEFALSEDETRGLDLEEQMALAGREAGRVESILPRLNSPGSHPSTFVTSGAEMTRLIGNKRRSER